MRDLALKARLMRGGGRRGLCLLAVLCLGALTFVLFVRHSTWLPSVSANPAQQNADPTVRISPATSSVGVGDVFTVDVMIDDAVDLGAYQFKMSFDPSIVHVLNVVDASFLGSTGRTVAPLPPAIDNAAGTVSFGAFTFGAPAGPSGTGTLATITLEAQGAGSTTLDLFDVIVLDTGGTEQPADVQDGTAHVGAAMVRIHPAVLSVAVGDNFTVDVMIDGAVDLGAYEFKMSFDPSIVHVLDVVDASFLGSTGRTVVPVGPTIDNAAGTVSFGAFTFGAPAGPSGDNKTLATITLEAMGAGSTVLNLFDVKVSDTNGNEQASADEDGTVMVGVGPTSTPTFTPTATPTITPTTTPTLTPTLTATPTITPTSTPTLTPTLTVTPTGTPTPTPTGTPAVGPRVLVFPATRLVGLGQAAVVEIRIEDVSDLYAADFHLSFDPILLQAQNVTPGGFLTGYVGVNKIDNEAGEISYAVTRQSPDPPVSESGVLATITFMALSEGSSPLTFISALLLDEGGNPIGATTGDGVILVGEVYLLYLPIVEKG